MLNRYATNSIHNRAARALAPDIAAAASRIEAERCLPADLLAKLHQARLFHMLVPKSVGGEEVDVLTFFAAVEAVASGDASVGWCVGQAGGVSTVAAYLDPAIAREIFGGHDSVVAWGPNARAARAVIAPGGYRVSGHWQFARAVVTPIGWARIARFLRPMALHPPKGMTGARAIAPCCCPNQRQSSPTSGR